MARKDDFAAHCAELLAGAGTVQLRRMFGGHGLYVDDLFVAIVAAEQLYLKANAATQAQFEAAGGTPFSYRGGDRTVTLNYWSVPAEAMDSPALMAPWARLAMQAALDARSSAKTPRARKPR